jgi:NAD(P)-dependent dehydrogenase (short-subunit alcohol dehydrogenase family)
VIWQFGNLGSGSPDCQLVMALWRFNGSAEDTMDFTGKAMLFLASDDVAFITGVALPVDGGRTIL